MTDAVEPYLDTLFDRLSGSGARGRRLLLEAQAHLDEAVERGVAAGQSREEAERLALARFGSADEIVRAHLEAGALSFGAAIGRVFAAGWLMSGVAGVAVGLMGVLDAVFLQISGASFITDDPPQALTADGCRQLGVVNGDAAACSAASVAHHAQDLIARSLTIGVLALIVIALFAVARRSPALRGVTRLPNAAMVSTAGAVGFGGVGLLLFGYGLLTYFMGERVEVGAHLAEGIAGIAAGLVFLPQAWRHVSVEA